MKFKVLLFLVKEAMMSSYFYLFIVFIKNIMRYSKKNVFVHFGAKISCSCLDEKVVIHKYAAVYSCSVGSFSYIGPRSIVLNAKIGKFCSIGSDVRICLGKHPIDLVSTTPIFYSSDIFQAAHFSLVQKDKFEGYENIIIGNDVWIGSNAIILDGVKIGDGAIVAAGAVVTKDIPPYAIVGGIPAKILRYRFDEETIKFLSDFKWWNKSLDWIKKNSNEFLNINKFKDINE